MRENLGFKSGMRHGFRTHDVTTTGHLLNPFQFVNRHRANKPQSRLRAEGKKRNEHLTRHALSRNRELTQDAAARKLRYRTMNHFMFKGVLHVIFLNNSPPPHSYVVSPLTLNVPFLP